MHACRSTLEDPTVGAGGGSIARVDAGGALRVGPESAGASPGPAAYGSGAGTAATVTDANLVLGRIEPASFLGGRMRLHPDRALRAVERLARAAGLSPRAAALGVVDVVNASMERALKAISVERGHDPSLFTLVAFGGAGGLHAVALARALAIPRVLVPRDPGLLSAKGLLMADAVRDLSATVLKRAGDLKRGEIERRFAPLESRARRELRAEGVAAARVRVRRSLDCRYLGQSFELAIPWSGSGNGRFERDFHAAHERAFGASNPAADVEVVAVRVRAEGPVRDSKPFGAASRRRVPRTRRTPRPRATREVVFAGGARRTAFHDRDALAPGDAVRGPAVIVEMSATTLVPAGASAAVDAHGHLVIEIEETNP